MDILGHSSLLVGITSFALGFSLLAKNVKNKLYLAFSILTTLVSGWALSFFLEEFWGGGMFYRLHLFFNIWLAPSSLAFIHVMVRIQDRISRRLLDLAVFSALALSIALVFHFESALWVKQLIYFLPGFIVLQLMQLMWIDRRLRRGLKRLPKLPTVGFARRNLIYMGGLAVLATSVMDHVPFMGKVLPSIGNIGLTIYLFFISQAISHQRLLNFGAMISRFLVLIAVALMLTAVYALLAVWNENSPELFFLNSFIASFLLLMLLEPLRKMVGYFTKRLLTQKHLRLEQVLREAQRRLTGVTDMSALFQAVLVTTHQTLQPEWAALFILRSDGTRYRRVRAIGDEPHGALKEMLVNHPLLQASDRLHKKGELPVLLDQVFENEMDRSASRVQREHLAALMQGLKAFGSNLLIPLYDGSAVLGFLTISAPNPPEPWGGNWGLLQVLYPYYEQVAQTMRSMEVFVKQREKERLATLGEMAAGLAHEIRNPLGAIKGAAQFLDPSPEKPEGKFLNIIIEEVDRLNRVVTQFLDYSKPFATDLAPLELTPLVDKTLELVRPSLQRGIQLEFTQPPRPAKVAGSQEQLKQVILNLVQNSLKALEGKVEGAIRVGLEVEGEGTAKEVVLSVEDNGKGIPKENMDKLFIPFFTTSPSGTGLGLSISQKIIEAHHGRIEVASEEGRFTRFSVILPYANAAKEQ